MDTRFLAFALRTSWSWQLLRTGQHEHVLAVATLNFHSRPRRLNGNRLQKTVATQSNEEMKLVPTVGAELGKRRRRLHCPSLTTKDDGHQLPLKLGRQSTARRFERFVGVDFSQMRETILAPVTARWHTSYS